MTPEAKAAELPIVRQEIVGPKVLRLHLLERFRANLNRRLTLVEAPAGYGKTTLMQQWFASLAQSGEYPVWVQVGADSIQTLAIEEQVLSSLVVAWSNSDFQLAVPSRAVNDDRTATLISILGLLASAPARSFLFFDDMHECTPTGADFLRNLLLNADDRTHFVIGTREPLGIPLTKLRVDQRISEFGVEDLRLNRSEVADLLADTALHDKVDTLYDYTEGWIAALQLLSQAGTAALPSGFDQQTGVGRQADVAKYLNEHFFSRLAPDLQSFLVDTAHLTTVNGDLADHILSSDHSWVKLAELASAHSLVFEIPGPDLGYRYHQLLRDFLVVRQTSLGERAVRNLHMRTAEWYFENNWLAPAVGNAVAARNIPRAVEMILQAGSVRIGMQLGAPRLAACLDQIPMNFIHATPRLIIARAYLLLKSARFDEAILYLTEARQRIVASDKEAQQEMVMVEAHLRTYEDQHLTEAQLAALEFTAKETPVTDDVMRGLFANFLCYFNIQAGNLTAALGHGEAALEIFRDLKLLHLQFFMYLHLSMIDLDWGHYEAALEKRQKALDLSRAQFRHDPALCALADIYFSEIAFEMGGADDVELRLSRALKQASRAEGWNEAFFCGYETCLKLGLKSGGFDAAIGYFAQAEAIAARRASRRFLRQLRILELELSLDAGRDAEIDRLTPQIISMLNNNDENDKLRWRGRILGRLALARAKSHFGDTNTALGLLDDVARDCRAKNLDRYLLRTEVLRTIVAAQSAAWTLARQSLKSVLALTQPRFFGAMIRQADAFVDAARDCVRHTGLGAFSPDETRKLADIMWVCTGHQISGGHTILMELLTAREYSVLRFLAKGDANKVIARELNLSDATIKFHVKNVFAKLGVHSRKLAADIAVAHGILEV